MNLKEIIEQFEYEMMAEGAWCGHEYAPTYLANIRENLITEFKKIESRYSYEKGYLYKDGKMCISAIEKKIWDNAKHGIWVLSDDYEVLINDIYKMDLSSNKKYIIADALNDAFKRKLEDAIDDAMEIIKEK